MVIDQVMIHQMLMWRCKVTPMGSNLHWLTRRKLSSSDQSHLNWYLTVVRAWIIEGQIALLLSTFLFRWQIPHRLVNHIQILIILLTDVILVNTVSVSGCDPHNRAKKYRTVSVAVAWTHPQIGQVCVLVINKAVHVPHLQKHLECLAEMLLRL